MNDGTQGELLRDFLAERDALCPQCGYNLRGLTAEVCPECRTALAVQVFAVASQRRVLKAGAVAISMGAAISLSVLGLLPFITLRGGRMNWLGPTLGERVTNGLVVFSCVAVLVVYVPVRLRVRAGLRDPQFALRGIHATVWMVSMFVGLAVLCVLLAYSVWMLRW